MSDTKVIEAINKVLINDSVLEGMLAKADFDKTVPAVYDSWAERDVEFPYIVNTYRFPGGDHWAKKSGNLNSDIFTRGNSSVEAENIKERVIELLDRRIFESDESGPIRVYLNMDSIMPEDTPEVVHWNIEFNVVFWRKKFISQLIV